MRPNQEPEIKTYLHTEGNLALTDKSLGLLQKPKPKPRLRLVEDITEQEDTSEVLAKEIIPIAGMSLLLCIMWFIIILVIYRMIV